MSIFAIAFCIRTARCWMELLGDVLRVHVGMPAHLQASLLRISQSVMRLLSAGLLLRPR